MSNTLTVDRTTGMLGTIERCAQRSLLVVSPPWTIVRGRFEGSRRTGEPVSIRFPDFLLFGSDRIVKRWSYFAGRSV